MRLAAGYESDDEGLVRKEVKSTATNGVNGVGSKRKRIQSEDGHNLTAKFKNFKPRTWETVIDLPGKNQKRIVKMSKPDGDQWQERWVDWKDDTPQGGGGEDEADVHQRQDVIVKVRRTAVGVERQRVERVLEEWIWSEGSPTLSPGDSSDEKAMSAETLEEKIAPSTDMVVA